MGMFLIYLNKGKLMFTPAHETLSAELTASKTLLIDITHKQNVLFRFVNLDSANAITLAVNGFHYFGNNKDKAVPLDEDNDAIKTSIVGSGSISAGNSSIQMINKADGSTIHYTHLEVILTHSANAQYSLHVYGFDY